MLDKQDEHQKVPHNEISHDEEAARRFRADSQFAGEVDAMAHDFAHRDEEKTVEELMIERLSPKVR